MGVDSASAGCVFDLTGTLARLGGDQALFIELTEFFYEDAPQIYASLREAANANDAKGVRSSAHALKGLVAGCGGVRAADVAQKVETAGQEGDLSHIKSLIDSLGEELELLKQALLVYSN